MYEPPWIAMLCRVDAGRRRVRLPALEGLEQFRQRKRAILQFQRKFRPRITDQVDAAVFGNEFVQIPKQSHG